MAFRTANKLRNLISITSRHPNLITYRGMTTASPRKFEWLIVVPDKPGTIAKRLEVRPTHFKNLQSHVEAGVFKMGGAILDDVPENDDASSFKFAGSTLVCVAESREEVLGYLKTDIYHETGVWDLEKAQIWALKCAFRQP